MTQLPTTRPQKPLGSVRARMAVPGTTTLYDRTGDEITLDEVKRTTI